MSFFIRNEERLSAEDNSVKFTQRSSLTDRYPRVFVESVQEPSLPLPDEKEPMEGKKKALCQDVRQPDSVFKYSGFGSPNFFHLRLFNNYPAKSRGIFNNYPAKSRGISSDT